MPILTASIADFNMTSSWTGTGAASTPSVNKTVNVSSIMAGSTINSALLSCSALIGLWGGIYTIDGNNFQSNSVTNLDVSDCISGDSSGFTMSINFKYRTIKSGYVDDGKRHDSALQLKNISIVIDYTLPYTACTPPTSVSAGSSDYAPGATVRVSWSGAGAGRNNPIASYVVYRSSDNSNWSELQAGITNEYLDVTAPTENGAVYYYKVKAVGTVSGYDSEVSYAYARVRCLYTEPYVTNVRLDNGTIDVHLPVGTAATLTWVGNAGTNNNIVKYLVQVNGGAAQEVNDTSLSITAPSTSAQYTITPVGQYSNGASKTSPTIYGYTNPEAPLSVVLDHDTVGKSQSVTLSWAGAVAGNQNAIIGYIIYRATTLNGTYNAYRTVQTTATSGSYSVTSQSTNDRYYYYKVATRCQYSNSAMSTQTAALHSYWTAPTVTSISLANGTVAPGTSTTLNFTVADGVNNPVASIEVYQDQTKVATLSPNETSYPVTAGSTAGDVITFKVKPIGLEITPESSLSDSALLKSYGNVTAPTSVSASPGTPDAGATSLLAWSGQDSGPNNPIVSYNVYRSTSASGTYTLLANTAEAGLRVTAPSVMGSSYYYKVESVGQYNVSAKSAAYATVTAKTYTVPGAPVATMTPAVAGLSDNPVLSWTAAADGTNNDVVGYRVFRATSQYGEYTQLWSSPYPNLRTLSVEKPETMGASYYYKVYAIGEKAGFDISPASNIVSLTTMVYTACGAPTAVNISSALCNAGASVTISWSGATAGTNNPISGYRVLRSSGGTFSTLSEVAANANQVVDTVGAAGTTYTYKIVTLSSVDAQFNSLESKSVSVTSNSPPGDIGPLTEPASKIYESGNIVISFNTPVDVNNNLEYYTIYRRVRSSASASWGSWDMPYQEQASSSVAKSTITLNGSSVTRGYQFQFRIRAEDTLGLTSNWKLTSVYTRNKLPVTPTIVYPVNNSTTYDVRPYFMVNVTADENGLSQYIDMSIDGGSFTQVLDLGFNSGNQVVRCYENLTVGASHTVSIRIRDALNAVSSSVSVTITCGSIEWERTITSGSIISRASSEFVDDRLIVLDGHFDNDELIVDNGTWDGDTLVIDDSGGGISHQQEILQMYTYVNAGLGYYGFESLEVPDLVGDDYSDAGDGKIGMFSAWGSQMLELYNAMKEIYTLIGVSAPKATITAGMMPTAAVVNTIRTMIENM